LKKEREHSKKLHEIEKNLWRKDLELQKKSIDSQDEIHQLKRQCLQKQLESSKAIEAIQKSDADERCASDLSNVDILTEVNK
jgi:rubrerythrin